MSRRVPSPAPLHGGRSAGWPMVVLLLAACSQTTPADPTPSDSGPNPTSTGSGSVSTTFIDPDDCQSSQDCQTEGGCVAPYDPLPQGMAGERGPAVCVEPCIEQNDLSQWCIDNASCCGTLRCNLVDGFCEPPGPVADESGTGTSAGTTTGTTTGTDTRGTTADSGTASSGSSTAATSDSTGTDADSGSTTRDAAGTTAG